MRNVIYNAQTAETIIIEVSDIEIPVIDENPASTIESRLDALEGTTEEIVVALNDKGLIP